MIEILLVRTEIIEYDVICILLTSCEKLSFLSVISHFYGLLRKTFEEILFVRYFYSFIFLYFACVLSSLF